MDEVRCPNCGTTKYANVHMRMMVNVCGHSLCENCVDLLFLKGVGNCPTCNVVLKRSQFKIQLYDDEDVEKDLQIRRKLLKEINLKEDDFESLREYNDFLETFESFVYNLANDIDTEETKRQIGQFKSENAGKTTKNRNKMSKDLELIEQLLEEEREAAANRNIGFSNGSSIVAKKVAAQKENLLDALLKSDLPAELILQSHKRKMETELSVISDEEARIADQRAATLAMKRQQKFTFSSGITFGNSGTNVFNEDAAHDFEAARFVYQPTEISTVGPPCPTPRTIVRNQYLVHIRPPNQADLAGGFSALYPCQRALQEAIIDLSFIPVNM